MILIVIWIRGMLVLKFKRGILCFVFFFFLNIYTFFVLENKFLVLFYFLIIIKRARNYLEYVYKEGYINFNKT
jgi:hypothetical protein